jgi:hypothetical protein
MEGVRDTRKLAVDIRHNTFVGLSRTYDGSHPLFPMAFFYPTVSPEAPAFPRARFTGFTVSRNTFVGYCPSSSPAQAYRGSLALTAAFSELNLDYSLKNKFVSLDRSIIGSRAYAHAAQRGPVRAAATIGARD